MDTYKNNIQSNIDAEAEVGLADEVVEEFELTGTTTKHCPRCGGKLLYRKRQSSYIVRCETENCLYLTFRGI